MWLSSLNTWQFGDKTQVKFFVEPGNSVNVCRHSGESVRDINLQCDVLWQIPVNAEISSSAKSVVLPRKVYADRQHAVSVSCLSLYNG